MELNEELESKSVPKIKKAASKIFKQKLFGYEEQLLSSLMLLIERPKSWQAQSEIIKALGVTGGEKSLSFLKELVNREFDSTVLYLDLSFSICLLHDISKEQLEYTMKFLNASNVLLASGACAAILYSGFIPSDAEIDKIINSVENLDSNEGQIVTPRTYIAACYTWPSGLTKGFLHKCAQSKLAGLVEIANDALAGKKSKYVLV